MTREEEIWEAMNKVRSGPGMEAASYKVLIRVIVALEDRVKQLEGGPLEVSLADEASNVYGLIVKNSNKYYFYKKPKISYGHYPADVLSLAEHLGWLKQ